MAEHSIKSQIPFLLFLNIFASAFCWDSAPLQDFCVAESSAAEINGFRCKDRAKVDPSDFKSFLLVKPGNTSNVLGSALKIGTASTFAGLNTQGLSFARIDYAPGGTVQPHFHPRASEVLFLLKGTLHAGFIDTQNRLFAETLGEGDLFVFPQGMLHFIRNLGRTPAVSLSGLNSQNPGAMPVAKNLFAAVPAVPDDVLSAAFRLPVAQVHAMEKKISASAGRNYGNGLFVNILLWIGLVLYMCT